MLKPVLLAAAASIAVAAPAYANPGGACSLSFDVDFDQAGRILQLGDGAAVCAGTIGQSQADPVAVQAHLGGFAAAGPSSCAPSFRTGRLDMAPRRLISLFENPDMEFLGEWTSTLSAPASALAGSGTVDGSRVALAGTIRFVARGACQATGYTPGRVQIDLSVGPGQGPGPQPRQEAAAPQEAPAAAPAERPKAKRKAKKATKRCRGTRKARRGGCRRARRR